MNIFSVRHLRRKAALQLLAVLLLFAQTLALMHGVAHAGPRAPQSVSTTTVVDGAVWSDLFGHNAGAGCDDWSAAFAPDANPDAGHVDVPVAPLDAATVIPGSQISFSAAPNGLSLARAPPRV